MLMSDESAEDGVRLLWQLHLLLAPNPSTCGFHKIKKREKERNPLLVEGKRTCTYDSRHGFQGVVNFIFAAV